MREARNRGVALLGIAQFERQRRFGQQIVDLGIAVAGTNELPATLQLPGAVVLNVGGKTGQALATPEDGELRCVGLPRKTDLHVDQRQRCSRAASAEATGHDDPFVATAAAGEVAHIKEVAVLALDAFLHRAAHDRGRDHHDVAEIFLADALGCTRAIKVERQAAEQGSRHAGIARRDRACADARLHGAAPQRLDCALVRLKALKGDEHGVRRVAAHVDAGRIHRVDGEAARSHQRHENSANCMSRSYSSRATRWKR